jgi:Ca2+-dependent lipid-binding protein
LGEVEIDVKEAIDKPNMFGIDRAFDIADPKDKSKTGKLGKLHLQIAYAPRGKNIEIPCPGFKLDGRLKVSVLKGTGLTSDGGGDAYAKVLVNGKEVGRTQTINSQNPVWNYATHARLKELDVIIATCYLIMYS